MTITEAIIERMKQSLDDDAGIIQETIATTNAKTVTVTCRCKIGIMGGAYDINAKTKVSATDTTEGDDHHCLFDPNQPELPMEDGK